MKNRIILASSRNKSKWLHQRLQYVTASEVASVLGKNRYQTAAQLFAVKTACVVIPDNEHMRRGREYELTVLQSAGIRFRPWSNLIASTKYPWLAATIDGLGMQNGQPVIMEAKCPARKWKSGEWQKYLPQVLTQLLVTGYDRGILIEGIGPKYTRCSITPIQIQDYTDMVDEILDMTYRFHCDMTRGVFGHDFWEASL